MSTERIITFRHKPSPLLDAAARVTDTLHRAGFEAGIVGGAVRDLLLGRTPSDCDIVTTATPQELEGLFDDCKLVGASFGVSLVREGNYEFEVATAREERFYLDGRHPEEVRYTRDLSVDMQRRDFTVNAMWYDPGVGVIHDVVGGYDDLNAGVLRTVGDALERFGEDYLRMLRAVRFAARTGFDLDPATETAMRELAGRCAGIAPERVRCELTAMLTGPFPSRALRLLERTGILAVILPEVAALKGCEQPPDFHPEGDVWRHTLLMLDHMAWPDARVAWSVLLHDVGKPPTAAVDETGRIRFFGHESRGAEMAEEILDRLRFSTADREAVVQAVRDHMRFASVPEMKEAKVRRLLADENFPLELELHRLDCIACHGMMEVFVFLLDRLREEPGVKNLPEPFVMGRDLIAAGYRPGAYFKPVLDEIYDRQLTGEFDSPMEALAAVDELLKQPRNFTPADPASDADEPETTD